VRQIQLLVALSLLVAPNAPSEGDKHKRPIDSMRAKGRKFLAFAYTSKRLTSEGEKPIPGTTIAGDPRVLPMGTRVRITEAGGYSGIYTVSDTGGKIKGRKIDVFVRNYAEARQFGRKQVYVTVLQWPENTARARRQSDKTMAVCSGCERKPPKAMITVDEAFRSNRDFPSRRGAPDGMGASPGGSDSRETGDPSSFSGVSTFERASLN
jgi:3D (Asp-Asp-Asp) domain-containing protein